MSFRTTLEGKKAMAVEEPIIQLQEEFYPFKTFKTQFPREEGKNYATYATSHTWLAIPSLGQFYILFVAGDQGEAHQLEILTPLSPEMGYPLDSEDLTYEQRKQKLLRLINTSLAQNTDHAGIGISAVILHKANYDNEDFLNLWQTKTDAWELAEAARVLFEHLFFVLTLPNGSAFAARGKGDSSSRWIDFAEFFPTDTGLLPEVAMYYNEYDALNKRYHQIRLGEEGFDLYLPQDRELLQAIKAKFVLLSGIN